MGRFEVHNDPRAMCRMWASACACVAAGVSRLTSSQRRSSGSATPEKCTSLLAHESGAIRILIFPMYFPYWLSQTQLNRIDWGSHDLWRARHRRRLRSVQAGWWRWEVADGVGRRQLMTTAPRTARDRSRRRGTGRTGGVARGFRTGALRRLHLSPPRLQCTLAPSGRRATSSFCGRR